MYSIGDVAKLAGLSVRMLRHYDEIGLLRPARVDPSTGYRWYESWQIARLHRILALKDLGFTLAQVTQILDDELSPLELRGMLRLRQAELVDELAHAEQRLRRIEMRIQYIEQEDTMAEIDVTLRSVDAVLVASASALAASFYPTDIAPVLSPLYGPLLERVAAAGLRPLGPPLAFYEDAADGESILASAAVPVNGVSGPIEGIELRELPAMEQAATALHRGSMYDCETTIAAMLRWIDDNGLRTLGYSREIYLDCPDDTSKWVTEIQFPVASQ